MRFHEYLSILFIWRLCEGFEGCPVGCPTSCACDTAVDGLLTIECSYFSEDDSIGKCVGMDVSDFYVHLNNLTSITPLDFINATNTSLIQITNGAQLTVIQIGAFEYLPSLETLSLQSNAIQSVYPGVFSNLTELRALDLSHNLIDKIRTDSFSGLNGLETLQMLGNCINTIEEGSFKDTSSLRSLVLANNQLTSLADDVFSGLHRVEDLQLQDNQLTQLSAETFNSMPSIKSLNLEFNRIQSIPQGLFTLLPNLNHLYLQSNQLSDLAGFSTPSNLTLISLERNPITKIPTNCFRNHPRLERIHLYEMSELSEIETGAFVGVDSLRSLALSDCPQLTSFTKDMLVPEGKVELMALFISNCSIERFDHELFLLLPNLQYASIHNNPFICDCSAEWMKSAMDDAINEWAESWKSGKEAVVCRNPQNVRDFRVYDLDAYDLTCEPSVFTLSTLVPKSDSVVFQALLNRGLPSTEWTFPDGSSIKPARVIDTLTQNEDKFEASEQLLKNKTVIATLTLKEITISDYGIYTLKATNAGGTASRVFKLTKASANTFWTTWTIVGVSVGGVFIVIILVGMIVLYRHYAGRQPYRSFSATPYEDEQGDDTEHREEASSGERSSLPGGVRSYGGTGDTLINPNADRARVV